MEETWRDNDEMKEQERVCMAQNYIEISSDFSSSSSADDSLEASFDYSSDSGARQKTTKPVTSSNESSTIPAKQKFDNEEKPLKQPHQDAFTLKQKAL